MSNASYVAIRKLERFGAMPSAERAALQEAFSQPVEVRAARDIVADGTVATQCSVVLSGFACRYKVLPDGGRQISAFLIPGDICDLQNLVIPKMDNGVAALTPCTVAFLSHTAVAHLLERFPGLGLRLWRENAIDTAIARQWITGLGRRSAHQRVAHLLCEIKARSEAVGRCMGTRFEFPITQADLSDAFGLSIVHVNRVLQALRREGLIAMEKRMVHILDWQKLAADAGFDPAYLHLDDAGLRDDGQPRVLPAPILSEMLKARALTH
jgi:CRP-like cAMP-binding protein